MNFLDKTGLATLWEKIKGRTILSETVRKIVIVDEYPEVEEEDVLYLKKGTGSSSGGEEETEVNLISTGTELNYRISTSGGCLTANVDYFSIAIPVEVNTRYIITRTLLTEHFRACCLNVETVTEQVEYTNLVDADTELTIDITTGADTKLLFICFYCAGDSYTHEEALADLKVIKYGT